LRTHQRGAHGVELGNQVHGSRLPRGEAADRSGRAAGPSLHRKATSTGQGQDAQSDPWLGKCRHRYSILGALEVRFCDRVGSHSGRFRIGSTAQLLADAFGRKSCLAQTIAGLGSRGPGLCSRLVSLSNLPCDFVKTVPVSSG
jgi:hypothetical protein